MGGLVSRAYIARHKADAEQRINRLIMHGTPHFGAVGAVHDMIMGNSMTAIASKLHEKNDVLRIVRNMPSVYQIMPAPPELFPSSRPYPVNWDIYDAVTWQVEGIRQDYLDNGREFHELLSGEDPQLEMIEIAGHDVDTMVEVRRSIEDDGQPSFDSIRIDRGPDSGDGTVPLWSALLPEATTYFVQEVHRYLPKRKPVIEATIELIHGGKPDLHTSIPLRRGVDIHIPAESSSKNVEALRARLEEGTASEEDLASLYFTN
jgi:hypothetical protein